MLEAIFFLIVGLLFLSKGADLLVGGASSLAIRLQISPLVVGLTVVAFGTSLPELVVNLIASVEGHSALAIGNILGSNIANILLILAIGACITPLKVQKSTIVSEIPFSILALIALFFMGNDLLLGEKKAFSSIGRGDGGVLLLFFLIFLYYIVSLIKQGAPFLEEELPKKPLPLGKSILWILIGLVGVSLGGDWTVEGAVSLARELGVSENLIGLTVVAFGTSVPELATSIAASLKKEADILVGNVVGSNIFNIFWVLGLSAFIRPIPYYPSYNVDLGVAFGSSLLTLLLVKFVGRKGFIARKEGILMLIGYFAYIGFKLLSS